MSADKVASCPRCHSTNLSVVEITENAGYTEFGQVRVINGELVPPSLFDFEPGNILSVRLTCGDCDHEWASRRPVSAGAGVERGES